MIEYFTNLMLFLMTTIIYFSVNAKCDRTIGFGAAAMLQARVTQETKRGTEETLSYLDKTASQDPNASKGHH